MAQGLDIFDEFALNPEKENDGTWVEYSNGVWFKIAYSNNRKFRARAAYFYKKDSKVLDMNNEASRDKLEDITIQVMAETVLLDWKTKTADAEVNTITFQKEQLEYSVTNAKRLLKLDKFREWAHEQASDMAKFKAVQEAEDEGN